MWNLINISINTQKIQLDCVVSIYYNTTCQNVLKCIFYI